MAFKKEVFQTACWMSLVVGTLLNLINQGDLILSKQWQSIHYGKVLLTFFVPYFVSTYSAIKMILKKK